MGGFSNVTGNSLGTIMNADNVSFDGTARGAPVTTNGQLLIGSTAAPHIRVGTLTSSDASVTITNGSGTIDLKAVGGGGGITTINGDTGFVTGATVSILSGHPTVGTVTFAGNVGHTTLQMNVTNSTNDTCIGKNSFANATPGLTAANLAYGVYTLNQCVDGQSNIAIGGLALQYGISPSHHIAIGNSALNNCDTPATENLAIGTGAMFNLTSGSYNVSLGTSTLFSALTGSYNICLGYSAGSNYTGSEGNNILIGAGVGGTIGESHVLRIGAGTGTGTGQLNSAYICGINGNTTANPVFVTVDTVTNQLGTSAGGGGGITTINGDTGSMTGATVSILGIDVGAGISQGTLRFINSGTKSHLYTTDANSNIGLGSNSLNVVSSGTENSALGPNSGVKITSGKQNVAIGSNALATLTTGQNHVAVGHQALTHLTTSTTGNTGVGDSAGADITTGTYNTLLGIGAGGAYGSSESSNICLGAYTNGTLGESNVMRLGNPSGGSGQTTATYVAGVYGVTVTGSAVLCSSSGQFGTIASSIAYKENIQNISQTTQSILSCRPVSFYYKSDETKAKCFGMIAEEVEQVFPDLVLYRNGKPDSIKYHEMPALLLAEIQKLRIEVDALKLSAKLN